jgi:hypothetical protein
MSFQIILIISQVNVTLSSVDINYIGEGDLVLMDYDIYDNQGFWNSTVDVYVYIGNLVPIHIDNTYYVIKHPEVFWRKVIGKPVPVPSDPFYFVIELSGTETTEYSASDSVIHGNEIRFHVTTKEIAYDASTVKNPLSDIPYIAELIPFITAFAILSILSFIGYKLFRRYENLIIKKKECLVCGQLSQGTCVKCGNSYCRNCFFKKGCIDCHSNQFKPEKYEKPT